MPGFADNPQFFNLCGTPCLFSVPSVVKLSNRLFTKQIVQATQPAKHLLCYRRHFALVYIISLLYSLPY
jgi:hypothetical protein